MSQIVGIGACVADTLILLPEFPTEDTKRGHSVSSSAAVALSLLG